MWGISGVKIQKASSYFQQVIANGLYTLWADTIRFKLKSWNRFKFVFIGETFDSSSGFPHIFVLGTDETANFARSSAHSLLRTLPKATWWNLKFIFIARGTWGRRWSDRWRFFGRIWITSFFICWKVKNNKCKIGNKFWNVYYKILIEAFLSWILILLIRNHFDSIR